MTTHRSKPPNTTGIYEEWIAHGGKREYVPLENHADWSSRPGWWTSGWKGKTATAQRLEAAERAARDQELPEEEESPMP